ncbi:hypothetical protein [Streptomyces sp. NPDC050264]|uniref:hypothetical protein n=1 Tax=Streptomyces sp. NPDC050264 TaxID=3155038 RepID=UPI0034453D39
MNTAAAPGLAAVGLLIVVEAREARTQVAAVASLGRGTATRAAVLPVLALAAPAGGAAAVLVVLPRGWAEAVGAVVVLVAGLQWLVWAARRELGAVSMRDETVVFHQVRRRTAMNGMVVGGAFTGHGTAAGVDPTVGGDASRGAKSVRATVAGALLRAGAEVLVVATGVAAAAVPSPWLPPLALLLVIAVVAPGLGACVTSPAGRTSSGTHSPRGETPGRVAETPTWLRHEGAPAPCDRTHRTTCADPTGYVTQTLPGRRTVTGPHERPAKAAIAVLLTAAGATAVTAGAVGVMTALLLPAAGLLVLAGYRCTARGRDAPPSPAPSAPVPHLRTLRDFVLGDDLAVWWAAAALVLATRLPWPAFRQGPAAVLLLTVLLAAVIGGAARRTRVPTTTGGDR